MSSVTKLYAAYKAGYLGDNILDVYFSFVANIVLEKHLTTVEDVAVVDAFREKYAIDLPIPFVRQVLGVGVQNGCFVEDHGKYGIEIEKLKIYRFDAADFQHLWEQLLSEFEKSCADDGVSIDSAKIEEFVLKVLDATDELILSGEKAENGKEVLPIEFEWYTFVKKQGEIGSKLYSFIAALSASNITKQALFYSGDSSVDYSNLNVYLDSPIIFALLGMDDEVREKSYKTLLTDMQKAKCNICVLDHNFQEVDSIITRAASWATDVNYDLRKANNAARFFHDSEMNEQEISEFCEGFKNKLDELGISIKETSYDVYQDKFQEDEKELFEMVKSRYLEHGYELLPEKEESIKVDVRSIVMIYRERQGQTATKLQYAKHIMLTSNSAIANVSKKYESNRSLQAGHIPACVSVDLFGAILWLNSPIQMLAYQKQKLLADCYAFLKPSKALLDKYIRSLDEARKADEIDEKKFLFLRSHKVVLDSLMDVTKGDYARFDSNTYREVYDDIEAKAQKKYRDEIAMHDQTRKEFQEYREKSEGEKVENRQTINDLSAQISELKENERKRKEKIFERKVTILGGFITTLFAGIPYVGLLSLLELIKTKFVGITWHSFFEFGGVIVITTGLAALFAKIKSFCFKKTRAWLSKHDKTANQN